MFRDYRNYATNLTIISGDLSGTGNYETASKHLFLNTGSSEQPISNGSVLDGRYLNTRLSRPLSIISIPCYPQPIFRNNKEKMAQLFPTQKALLCLPVLFHNNEASAAVELYGLTITLCLN